MENTGATPLVSVKLFQFEQSDAVHIGGTLRRKAILNSCKTFYMYIQFLVLTQTRPFCVAMPSYKILI